MTSCAHTLGSLIFLLIVAAYCDHRDWLCQPGAWRPSAESAARTCRRVDWI